LEDNKGLRCDAAIMSETSISGMHGGTYAEADCAGSATHSCVRVSGRVDRARDCNILKVGTPITTVPLAMPVRNSISAAMDYGLLQEEVVGTISKLSN